MLKIGSHVEKDFLDKQHPHWEGMLSKNTDMFGLEPSQAARKAADAFKEKGARKILELGGGQGRDTLFLRVRVSR